ncbi:MAG: hypothetical protein M3Z04_00880 [Chloroflexota bacterium]|nr:hypothetical protein [Chloroflexota bacterium]
MHDAMSTGSERPADLCAELGLTTHRLPERLRQTGDGTPFAATQIRLGGNPANLPAALFTLPEPARGWESLLAVNAAAVLGTFTQRGAEYLTGSGPAPLTERLATLRATLAAEAAALTADQKRARVDYERICGILRTQQEALMAGRKGLLRALVGIAFDAVKAVGLWNDRERRALLLESGEAARGVLATCMAHLDEAGSNLRAWHDLAATAQLVLAEELTAAGQTLAVGRDLVPDLALDHARLAVRLAARDPGTAAGLNRIFTPPPDLSTLLVDLRAGAAAAAAAQVESLTLAGALELQRQVDALPDGANPLLLLGQAVLTAGCLRRSFARVGRPQGQHTLVQLTPDGRLLFQARVAHGGTTSAPGGLPGQIGFLALVEQLDPLDLVAVRRAAAAQADYEARQNTHLLEELLDPEPPAAPVDRPAGAGPLAPALSLDPEPSAAPVNGYADRPADLVPRAGV